MSDDQIAIDDDMATDSEVAFSALVDALRIAAEAYMAEGMTRTEAVSATMAGLDDYANDEALDRKSTRLNSSHIQKSRMPSSA